MLQHLGEIGGDDGVDPRDLEKLFKKELIQSATQPKVDRKALQLCRQVERVLMFVVPELVSDELDATSSFEPVSDSHTDSDSQSREQAGSNPTIERLLTAEILGVIPAPRTNHLLATIQLAEASSETEIRELEHYLKSCRGQIRSEVAASINRRKTPDISFRVVNPDA